MHNKEIEKIKIIFLDKLSTPDSKWPFDVKRIVNLIHSCLFKEYLTIAYIREKCSINDNGFAGQFKYFVGKTPKDYILFLRITCAKKILECNLDKISMTDISYSLGFTTLAGFSLCFKSRTHLPPSAWVKTKFK
ncbi:MAG: AraC family transcriptional regulator [Candidatus Paceibacterota bacterium]